MNEDFLQFVWQQQLFDKSAFETVSGDKIEIIKSGFLNKDSGPDFFDVQLKIGDQLWAGAVEVHQKSSDWYLHKHHLDKSYNNVILHVVGQYNKAVFNEAGSEVLTAVLKYDARLYDNYLRLITNKGDIACADYLPKIDFFVIKSWFTRLLVERLERKSKEVLEILKNNNEYWEETFYTVLARNFGFKTNSMPFEMLAKSLPMKALEKQKYDLRQIEALVFGQAGFLEEEAIDEYHSYLKKEYEFLKQKYDLKPIDKSMWKFMRMRPSNFPTIRLAQFSAIMYNNVNLFSKIIEIEEVDEIKGFFKKEVSDYWKKHYDFGKQWSRGVNSVGNTTIDNILINTVALMIFVYGLVNDDEAIKSRALEMLYTIKPETNNIIKKWNKAGIETKSAYETQAAIELFNEYCKKGKCINCQIGTQIIIREKYD